MRTEASPIRSDENPSDRALTSLRTLRRRYQADVEWVRDRVEEDVSDEDVESFSDQEVQLEERLSSIADWIEHLEQFNAYDAPEAFPEFAAWVAEARDEVRRRLVELRILYTRDPDGFLSFAKRGRLVTGSVKDLLRLVSLLPTGESLALETVYSVDQGALWAPIMRNFGAWSRSQLETFLYEVFLGLDDPGLFYQAVSPTERLVLRRILR